MLHNLTKTVGHMSLNRSLHTWLSGCFGAAGADGLGRSTFVQFVCQLPACNVALQDSTRYITQILLESVLDESCLWDTRNFVMKYREKSIHSRLLLTLDAANALDNFIEIRESFADEPICL